MPMKRCSADEHYFDDKMHTECPFCRKTHVKSEQPDQDTASKTGRDRNDVTRPVHNTGGGKSSKTRPIWDKFPQSDQAVPPVVGWLVVVDGPGIGRDLRITPGMNRVGRDADMSLRIDFGDETISRSEHAFLIYDLLNNTFFIKHGSGQNLTYLNNSMVMDATVLKAHDHIRVGKTELLFVPLCTAAFKWDSGKKPESPQHNKPQPDNP